MSEFKKGTVVEVFNHTMGGKKVSEGQAVIRSLQYDDEIPEDRIWAVRFKGEYDDYNRRESMMSII